MSVILDGRELRGRYSGRNFRVIATSGQHERVGRLAIIVESNATARRTQRAKGSERSHGPLCMQRFQQVLLIVSMLALSWLMMQAVHEFGHVVAAWATGGAVTKVVLHPSALSRTDVEPNPQPLAVAWGGPLIGIAHSVMDLGHCGRRTAFVGVSVSVLRRFLPGGEWIVSRRGLLRRRGRCGRYPQAWRAVLDSACFRRNNGAAGFCTLESSGVEIWNWPWCSNGFTTLGVGLRNRISCGHSAGMDF